MAPLGLTLNHGFALPRNDFAWSPRAHEAYRPLSGAQDLHRDAQLALANTKKIAVDPETAWWNCYRSQGTLASSSESTGSNSCSTSSWSSTSLATPPQDNVILMGGACSHSEGLKVKMTPKHIALLEQICYEAHIWELDTASQKRSNISEMTRREKNCYESSGFVPPGDWMFALQKRLMEQPEPHTDFCIAPVARRTLPLPIDPFAANAFTGDIPLYSAATTTPVTAGPREPLLFAPVRPRKLQTRRKQDGIKWDNAFLGKGVAHNGQTMWGTLTQSSLADQLEMDLGRGRSYDAKELLYYAVGKRADGQELELPYEVVTVDIAKGEHKTEAYLAKNPFGVITAIDDDGFVLFESQAICKYLVSRYGQDTTLAARSSDIFGTAKYEQALSVEAYTTHMQLVKLGYEKKFNPMFGQRVDEKKCQMYISQLEHAMTSYERILSKQKYLAGDYVTLADLFHIPWGWIVNNEQVITVLEGHPSVRRWWKDISSRAAWKATLKSV